MSIRKLDGNKGAEGGKNVFAKRYILAVMVKSRGDTEAFDQSFIPAGR